MSEEKKQGPTADELRKITQQNYMQIKDDEEDISR